MEARERREEKLSDSIYAEMKRVLAKAWELLAKTEAEGDHIEGPDKRGIGKVAASPGGSRFS